MAQIRLDKFLSNRTAYSRSEVKKLLQGGKVLVDGNAIIDGSRKIDPDVQSVTCCGKPVRTNEHVYVIVNKPEGFITATEDREHRTVMELVPEELRVRGLAPAGRLDIDSTGLLLLTDDGDLAHRMLSPRHHVPKVYLIRLAHAVEPDYTDKLRAGLTLTDGTACLPAEFLPLPVQGHHALIRLHEGKYHQVKRMLAALGNHVEHLHRVAVGALILPPELPMGGHLEILHKDVEKLLKPGDLSALCERIVSEFSSYSINEG